MPYYNRDPKRDHNFDNHSYYVPARFVILLGGNYPNYIQALVLEGEKLLAFQGLSSWVVRFPNLTQASNLKTRSSWFFGLFSVLRRSPNHQQGKGCSQNNHPSGRTPHLKKMLSHVDFMAGVSLKVAVVKIISLNEVAIVIRPQIVFHPPPSIH